VAPPHENLPPEIMHVINSVLSAFAREDLPAMVLLPSDDLATARAQFAHLLALYSKTA
jgi:hypothetical protein